MPRVGPISYAPDKAPLPFVNHVVLPNIALACIMACRPPSVLKYGASLLLIYTALYAAVTFTTGDPVEDYTLGSTVLANFILNVITFVWLTDPIKDIRYVKNPVPLTVKPLFTRVWYAICLLFNARLIGTSAQVAHVPPPFRGSRSQFLWNRLKKLAITFVLLDTTEYFVSICLHLYVPEEAAVHAYSGLRGHLVRSASTAVWLLMTYSSLNYTYLLMSIFAVVTGLGNGNPEDWPDAFGQWSRAYTLRNLWGRVWHQLFRRHFARIGKIAVRILRVPRNTWLSSQVQIHAAFATSALLHSMGDLVLNPAALGRSAPFFVLNALAITAEDTIDAIARRAGLPRATESFALRILGYSWVTLWILNTVPLYLSWVYANEFGGYSSLPYSPVRKLVVPFVQRIMAK